MAIKNTELAAAIEAINTQLDKASTEIFDEIKTLTDSLGNVEIPQEAQDSLDRLKTKVQALDDLNPDAPVTPPPTV